MGVSIRPSDFVEGGAVPVDRNLLWETIRFELWDYQGKAPVTTAAHLHIKDDDGQEFDQYYSVGDPERFTPSSDGKTLIAAGEAQSLSKSSNFYLLLNATINAGFPENRIPESGDISVFDGLYAYHIGLPEPKRAGLVRAPREDGQAARERVITVPSRILRLPWEKGKGKAVAAKVPAKASAGGAEESDEGDGSVVAKAVEFVGKHVGEDGKVVRQSVAVAVFKDLAKDPDKDAVAGLIFGSNPVFLAALAAKGYSLVDKA